MTDRPHVRPHIANRPKRTKPAVASRIAIVGLSASAGFGLVATLGAANADNVEFTTVAADAAPTSVPGTVPAPSPIPPAKRQIVRVVVVASPPAAATAAPSRSRPSAPAPAPSAQPAPAPAPTPAATTVSKSS